MKIDSNIKPPEYEGSHKVNPDNAKVNGRVILGWAVLRESGGARLRKWIELFRPGTLSPDLVPVPLVDGSVIPAMGPAPPMPPVAPPANPVMTEIPPKLKELRRQCNMLKNMGQQKVDVDLVLKHFEP